VNPFDSIVSGQSNQTDGLKNPGATTHALQGLTQPSDRARNPGAGVNRGSNGSGSAVILRHPAAPEPSPAGQYLDPRVDLESLP
jgi:hypothetical protein